mmetsp:Transcript_23247/g.65280  ORF Transcript_23247/g.65280 Transcript_23247/m.65280 type:complete len:128 (+) Transcript_23247:34-417(+)
MADLDIGLTGPGFDPFADLAAEDAAQEKKRKKKKEAQEKAEKSIVHIRVQQRNGRKSLTTVQGINPKIDQKKVLKGFKKEFCCNGTVVEDSEFGEVIQLQGDQRQNVQTFLVQEKLVKKDNIKVHGF